METKAYLELVRLDTRTEGHQGEVITAHVEIPSNATGYFVLELNVLVPSKDEDDQLIEYEYQWQNEVAANTWVPSAAKARWRGKQETPTHLAIGLDIGDGANLKGRTVKGCLSSRNKAQCELILSIQSSIPGTPSAEVAR